MDNLFVGDTNGRRKKSNDTQQQEEKKPKQKSFFSKALSIIMAMLLLPLSFMMMYWIVTRGIPTKIKTLEMTTYNYIEDTNTVAVLNDKGQVVELSIGNPFENDVPKVGEDIKITVVEFKSFKGNRSQWIYSLKSLN